jgi:hypothetical protein
MKAAKGKTAREAAQEDKGELYRRGGGVAKKKRDHEKLNTGGVVARARGGGVSPAPTAANYPDVAKIERDHHRIRVEKKRGGAVEGKKAAHRIDKRARGGRMTPGSPFSGADAPNLGYATGAGPESKPEGRGKD